MFTGWRLPVLKFGGLHTFRGNLLFFCILLCLIDKHFILYNLLILDIDLCVYLSKCLWRLMIVLSFNKFFWIFGIVDLAGELLVVKRWLLTFCDLSLSFNYALPLFDALPPQQSASYFYREVITCNKHFVHIILLALSAHWCFEFIFVVVWKLWLNRLDSWTRRLNTALTRPVDFNYVLLFIFLDSKYFRH